MPTTLFVGFPSSDIFKLNEKGQLLAHDKMSETFRGQCLELKGN